MSQIDNLNDFGMMVRRGELISCKVLAAQFVSEVRAPLENPSEEFSGFWLRLSPINYEEYLCSRKGDQEFDRKSAGLLLERYLPARHFAPNNIRQPVRTQAHTGARITDFS